MSALAIRYSNLPWPALRMAGAAVWFVGFAAAFIVSRRRRRILGWFLAAFAAVLVWWILIPASNDGDWIPEYAVQPSAEFQGSRVTVRNIRNFEYRSVADFTPRYYDRTFDLEDLIGIDFVKSHWEGPAIAHTMLSFGFWDGWHLVLSVETRMEKGEIQGGLPGLFKQYEIMYILGDERDLLRLRTNYRKERVYLFPLKVGAKEARIVLRDILEKAERLRTQPEFYNTLTHNCSVGLMPHFDRIRTEPPRFDIRRLLNGYSDEMIYENGHMDTVLSLEETRKLALINQYVQEDPDPADYSAKIRRSFPKLRGQ